MKILHVSPGQVERYEKDTIHTFILPSEDAEVGELLKVELEDSQDESLQELIEITSCMKVRVRDIPSRVFARTSPALKNRKDIARELRKAEKVSLNELMDTVVYIFTGRKFNYSLSKLNSMVAKNPQFKNCGNKESLNVNIKGESLLHSKMKTVIPDETLFNGGMENCRNTQRPPLEDSRSTSTTSMKPTRMELSNMNLRAFLLLGKKPDIFWSGARRNWRTLKSS